MTDPISLPIERCDPFDPPDQLRLQRDKEPIARLSYPDGHLGWLVTSYAASRALLTDPRFSNRQELRHNAISGELRQEPPAAPGMFLRTDPPVHTRYRRLLTRHFNGRRMKQFTTQIEHAVTDCLDTMAMAGPPADLVEAYALPVSLMIICELLGIPPELRESFGRESKLAAHPETPMGERKRAFADIAVLLAKIVATKKASPANGILGDLIAGGDLNDKELANITLLLLVVGHETTANMLALGTFALLQHPDQLAIFTGSTEPEVVQAAVEELLRYLTIIQFGTVRTALEDVQLENIRIAAGESVTISLPAANRDPGAFPNPDALDLTRRTTGHLAFGHGTHQCLGQRLARIELRLGLAGLFQRFPNLRLATPPDRVPLRDHMAVYGVHELPVAW